MSVKAKTSEKKKITLKTAIAYGLPDLMGSGGFTVMGIYFMFFLTRYAGITPMEAGSIVAISRVVDAIVCLFMGPLTDDFYKNKLGQKFGRRRFFLLFGGPLTLVYILLWVVGPGYVYYLVVYLLFEILSASLLIPWETLPSEMTTNYVERTKLSATRMTISAAGAFLATFIPAQVIGYFGENQSSYLINGILWAIMFVIAWLLCYKVTWERPITEKIKREIENREKQSIGDLVKDYMSTLRVKAFRKHLYVYLLSFTGKDFHNAIFMYFIVYSFGLTQQLSSSLLSVSVIGIPSCVIAGFLMIKWGPKWLLIIAYSLMLLMLGSYWYVYNIRPDNIVLALYIIAFVYQIGRSILEFTPWNIFPFIPDLDELLTRQRREGLFAGVMTVTRKTTLSFAFIIIGFVLDQSGFVQGSATQTPHVLYVITVCLVFGTGILIVLSLLIAATFRLNKNTHSVIIAEIERLRAGGKKEDVKPEVKKICENLVGGKYENMWKPIK